MKKIIICILCLFALCGCNQQESSNNKENEKQIEKVKNYKNNVVVLENNNTLKPGEKFTDINRYLVDYVKTEIESSAVFYNNDDIEIFVGGDNKVKKITLLTNKYKIDNQIKVGSSLKEMKKIYKDETEDSLNKKSLKNYHIDNINVTFTIKNEKISQIELEIDTYS